ncbi:MAG: PQQ-like beta-propeller repeat protein [Pirellulaceae bacterium]|jgi:outer membrane protein assembly factor BamB|nr:PQQ-like beta-propeller repeat protein [Pirellulaceae bacterium]
MVVDGFLFSVNATGVAFCYEAATGKVQWQERLGRHHASPVLIEGLVYFISDFCAILCTGLDEPFRSQIQQTVLH